MMFPSVEWFEAVKTEADKEAALFQSLGFCDATMRVDVIDAEAARARSFQLVFEDYGCTGVSEVDAASPPPCDFALAAADSVWREMVANIQEHGAADLHHTLSYLQLPGTLELVADAQLQADIFYRFNQTFQQFFDLSSRVPTELGSA